jgi:PAS domain S-box-containing protein
MMKRGALDYLVKDVNFVEFIPTVVRRALTQLKNEQRLATAEETVLRSEERYRTLFNTLIEGFCTIEVIFDPAGKPVDYRFLEVNPAFETQTGLRNAQGRLMRDLVPDHEAHWFEIYGKIALTGEPAHFENEAKALGRYYDVSAYRIGGPGSHKVAILFNDITRRKKLEQEILEISEREQRRFGHDMHDGLGQRLTGLEMLSHALADDLKGHAPALTKQARRLNHELRETVTQVRLISHRLAPVPLEGEGLMRGLMELATSTSRIPKVACAFTCDPPVCIQDVATATHLYRIAQEAVNNALKHGRARKIDITLTERAEGVELIVENNGRPLAASKPLNSGMGLNVMRYRAEMIGARLSIDSGKRKGVRVICTLRRKT